eukprot:s889_g21.t1
MQFGPQLRTDPMAEFSLAASNVVVKRPVTAGSEQQEDLVTLSRSHLHHLLDFKEEAQWRQGENGDAARFFAGVDGHHGLGTRRALPGEGEQKAERHQRHKRHAAGGILFCLSEMRFFGLDQWHLLSVSRQRWKDVGLLPGQKEDSPIPCGIRMRGQRRAVLSVRVWNRVTLKAPAVLRGQSWTVARSMGQGRGE